MIDKIGSIRTEEVYYLGRMNYLIVVFVLCIAGIPTVMPVIIFYTYVALGNQLDGAKSFSVLALLALIQNPMYLIPQLLQQYMMASLSSKRIVDFLESDELADYVEKVDDDKYAIVMTNASLAWISCQSKLAITKDEKEKINKKEYDKVKEFDDIIEIAQEKEENDDLNNNNRSLNTLINMNLKLEKGKLYCVIGPVGNLNPNLALI